MSIRAAIYDLLDDVNSNVFALVAPQELDSVYAVFSIRTEPIRTQSGVAISEVYLTLNIYGNMDSRSDVLTRADAFYSGLEGKSGSYSDQTLMVCNWVSESEDYIPDLQKWNITQEYELKF